MSKLLKKCNICIRSDGLLAITFWLRSDQRDSWLSQKLGQSNIKWLTSSMLSLQRRQSSPSVLVSQGTPPLIPKFSMRIDRGKCSLNMLEPLAYWGGECKIDTNYLLFIREFLFSLLFSSSCMWEKWIH